MAKGNPYGDFEIDDPKAMRALAHPVRLALLERLRRHGPATASQLSPQVGATPSVASWHLRHLAEFGLVRDAEPGPDRRERRWEAVASGFRFGGVAQTPEGRDAARTLIEQIILRARDLPQRWASEVAPELEPEWQDEGGIYDTRIYATAEEAAQIAQAMEMVLAPFVLRGAEKAPDGARPVRYLRYILPESGDDE
ncbi:helix-turn-helix domain-containing protein [Catenulispora subtropica]|uniref:Helix-turn-helix domain-containing protein n=1 Tax=Catenulispora subtropica TaxID=450798 RepID=A0ABP5E685_9ACTN